jgi:multiple sugar transport system substrate-binding protein
MMTMKRSLFAATLLAAGLGAGAASAADLRATVWTGAKPQLDMFADFANAFKQSHPDISMKFETIPAGDYTQKLTFQLAGGNAPDFGWIMEDSAPAFEDAGALVDLAPALKAAAGYDFADFSAPAMGLWQTGDKVWGIPFSTSPFLIYYNKDLFDKAGLEDPATLANKGEWTMDKWREAAKTIKEKTGVWGFQFKDGQGYDTRIMHAMMPPIRAYGGFAWNGKECGFDKPEAVAAMTVLHDMVYTDKSIVPPGDQSDFFAGNAAMTINQISRIPNLAKATFKWGIAPLPTGPAGASPVIGQAAFVVFAQSKNQDAATEALAFITNKANVATMGKYFPPARKSVLADPAFVNGNPAIPPEQMKFVADAIANGKVLPANVHAPQILAAMAPKVDAFWKADADPQKAMEGVCAAIKPLL